MKKYEFHLELHQQFAEPVEGHAFLLRCTPLTCSFQRPYAHHLVTTPKAALTHTTDVFGNNMVTGTIDRPHNSFSFSSHGFVLSSKYLTHEPLDRLFLYPTAYTAPSEEMRDYLKQTLLPEDPWQRALSLCETTRRLMTFANQPIRTSAEHFHDRTGDARGIAHVMLSLCRLSGIPARFASGLAVGIDGPHAWTEVYTGGVWRALDPSRNQAVETGYLKFAHAPDWEQSSTLRSCSRSLSSPSGETVHTNVREHVVTIRETVPHA